MSIDSAGPRPQTRTEAFLERHVIGPDMPLPTARVAVTGGAIVMGVAITLALVASYALPLPDPAREARILSPGRPLAPMQPIQPQLAAYPPAEVEPPSYIHFTSYPATPMPAAVPTPPPAPPAPRYEAETALPPPPPPPVEVAERAPEPQRTWFEAPREEPAAPSAEEEVYDNADAELVWQSSDDGGEEAF